jgi:hypothetical protein
MIIFSFFHYTFLAKKNKENLISEFRSLNMHLQDMNKESASADSSAERGQHCWQNSLRVSAHPAWKAFF